jgi:hypothetical protein
MPVTCSPRARHRLTGRCGQQAIIHPRMGIARGSSFSLPPLALPVPISTLASLPPSSSPCHAARCHRASTAGCRHPQACECHLCAVPSASRQDAGQHDRMRHRTTGFFLCEHSTVTGRLPFSSGQANATTNFAVLRSPSMTRRPPLVTAGPHHHPTDRGSIRPNERSRCVGVN